LARAAEQFEGDRAEWIAARMTIDFFKPLPLQPLVVQVEPNKYGKSVRRVRARLFRDGDELAQATAVKIRRKPNSAVSPRPPSLPSPEGLAAFDFPFFLQDVGYHRGIEGRYLRGAFEDNAVTVWMRPKAPLVLGETMTGLQRLALLADAQSGVCNPLNIRHYTFVNPDLTLLLDREPQGEWIGLEALATASPEGIGLAQSAVYDSYGLVGRSAQTLVVDERPQR
jgi:hypothetical protein